MSHIALYAITIGLWLMLTIWLVMTAYGTGYSWCDREWLKAIRKLDSKTRIEIFAELSRNRNDFLEKKEQ